MRKSIILTLVVFVVATGIINEAEAKSLAFEIPLEEGMTKMGSVAETGVKKERESKSSGVANKVPGVVVEQKQEQEPVIDTEAKDKEVLTSHGFKADHCAIYKKAAEVYGLEWQYLAAVHKIESGQSGNTTRSSSAGATGPMQFIPSTFRAYAVDGDSNGSKEINDVDDAIFTAAHYLSANKKSSDMTHALFRYNHSMSYVNKVKSMANSLK